MLTTNTMRYGTDSFAFRKQALIFSRKALSGVGMTDIEGFEIQGTEPAGSSRRVIFKVNNMYYNLYVDDVGLAEPQLLVNQSPTIESVLSEGNTISDLNRVTSIPTWVEKEVYPVIALDAPPEATSSELPTIKLGLKVRSNNDQYSNDDISAIYDIKDDNGEPSELIEIKADVTATSTAGAVVYFAVQEEEGGEFSDWINIDDASGHKGIAIKYRVVYTVSEIGAGQSVKVNSISCQYCGTSSSVVTDASTELITKTMAYDINLSYAQCILRHKKILDASIEVYAKFISSTKTQELVNLGTGNGFEQVLSLPDNNIEAGSLVVFVNGAATTNFDFNTLSNEITITAPIGNTITATYSYGMESEQWHKLDLLTTQSTDGFIYTSKFQAHCDVEEASQTAIMVKIGRPTGTVENIVLGTGTGNKQLFVLKHYAKSESLVVNANSFSYDENNKILSVVAPKGTTITASYDWIAESPEIYSMYCGWAE